MTQGLVAANDVMMPQHTDVRSQALAHRPQCVTSHLTAHSGPLRDCVTSGKWYSLSMPRQLLHGVNGTSSTLFATGLIDHTIWAALSKTQPVSGLARVLFASLPQGCELPGSRPPPKGATKA